MPVVARMGVTSRALHDEYGVWIRCEVRMRVSHGTSAAAATDEVLHLKRERREFYMHIKMRPEPGDQEGNRDTASDG